MSIRQIIALNEDSSNLEALQDGDSLAVRDILNINDASGSPTVEVADNGSGVHISTRGTNEDLKIEANGTGTTDIQDVTFDGSDVTSTGEASFATVKATGGVSASGASSFETISADSIAATGAITASTVSATAGVSASGTSDLAAVTVDSITASGNGDFATVSADSMAATGAITSNTLSATAGLSASGTSSVEILEVSGLTSLDGGLGADLVFGGYYGLNNQTTTNMQSKGTAYAINQSGTGQKIAIADNAQLDFGTGGGAVMVEVLMPSVAGDVVFAERWTNSTNHFQLWYKQSTTQLIGKFVVGGVEINVKATWVPTAYTNYNLVWAFIPNGASETQELYVNGISLTLATDTNNLSDMSLALPLEIGADESTDTQAFTINRYLHLNLHPTSAEVKDIISASTPYRWIGASQTAKTSGTLTIGKQYIIDTYAATDDFDDAGVVVVSGTINVSGCVFIAGVASPTDWTNGSSLRSQGVTADYPSYAISDATWYDVSGNSNNGAVTGATVLSYEGAHSDGTDLFVDRKFIAPYTVSAKTTAVTLTIAELITGLITGTHSAGATAAYVVPTGTLTDAALGMSINDSFDWVLINLSAAAIDTITVTAGDTHTVVGNMIVQSAHSTTGALYGNSAQFRTRKTAANTFVTYRIA